jgi:hypothetical protein
MTHKFSGDWTIEVTWAGVTADPAEVVDRSRRFIIDGALAGNGAHPVNFGPGWRSPVTVSGPNWLIWIEVFRAAGWQRDTNQQRSSAAYTLGDGLVVNLTAGNWITPTPGALVAQSDSAALRCRNHDPKLTPWPQPFAAAYDFTIPPQRRRPVRPARPPTR